MKINLGVAAPRQPRGHYHMLLLLAVLLVVICVFGKGALVAGNNMRPVLDTSSTYKNPVFEPILADPTVIREPGTGVFYAYGTQDNWGDGKGSRLMPMLRSKDLVHWEYAGEVFTKKPDWKKNGGLWAPDINLIDGKYYLYYSYSLWGDPDPGIGLAIASKPDGPFVDQGKLFTSREMGVPNSIDPSFFNEEGKPYLIWGSFGKGPNQGIHIIELSSDGREVMPAEKKIQLAAGDWEAAMIHYRDGFYYFFGSKGSCCEGANSQYKVFTARSKSLAGPYLDRAGKRITERGNGTLLLQGDALFVGPGHHAKIITDDANQDWLLYHAIWKKNDKVSSGASRRVLMLDRLLWKDGWPRMEAGTPSSKENKIPLFNKK
ncbi:family 43 glycosylhydrolase [Sphingobacterium griseoflavum]|uniref:Arabinan endo-1,5-alpha-L-arabinosidase n=1 Tax=Sphingobacterium griseoflavum TaxID=1474952 RepID=A0ABQ3I257_9SPHI|nr:family 43 glycosylhydrolase [Sphingobacterium griseoflavum]GHE47239.1 arabinan endo-1,5-alpha-L-arabinosidase [Sphingobacterium griseoflavum]